MNQTVYLLNFYDWKQGPWNTYGVYHSIKDTLQAAIANGDTFRGQLIQIERVTTSAGGPTLHEQHCFACKGFYAVIWDEFTGGCPLCGRANAHACEVGED